MGLIRMGPPQELILQLKERYALTHFVETGTYRGDTAAWAASHFERVITIEGSRKLYDLAVQRHTGVRNVEFLLGDSRSLLPSVIARLPAPAIVWLDSHWCGGESYGMEDQCPLLDELRTIHQAETTHFLFVDDARLFESPPPLPNRIEDWPSIDRVVGALQARDGGYYITVHEDVIIAVPEYARMTVAAYCQAANTKVWNAMGQSGNGGPVRRGWRLTCEGLRLMTQGLGTSVRRLAGKVLRGLRFR